MTHWNQYRPNRSLRRRVVRSVSGYRMTIYCLPKMWSIWPSLARHSRGTCATVSTVIQWGDTSAEKGRGALYNDASTGCGWMGLFDKGSRAATSAQG